MRILKNPTLNFLFPAFLSGILFATSSVPSLPWAVLFSLIPLWIDCHKTASLREVLFKSWLFQFTLSLVGFVFLFSMAKNYFNMSVGKSATYVVLFLSFSQIHFAIATCVSWQINRKRQLNGPAALLTYPLILIAIKDIWPRVYPAQMTFSLIPYDIPIIQLADTIGFSGIESLAYIVQGALAYAFINKNRSVRTTVITVCFLLISSLWICGKGVENKWAERIVSEPDSYSIGIIQDNVHNDPSYQALDGDEKRFYRLNKNIKLTDTLVQETRNPLDLVVWSETAIPFDFNFDMEKNHPELTLFSKIRQWHTYLIAGGYSSYKTASNSSKKTVLNSSLIFNNYGALLEIKNKSQFHPFSEVNPLRNWYKNITAAEEVANTNTQKPFQWNENLVGIMICYETVFPSLANSLSEQGAKLLIELSNDFWFTTELFARHHLYFSAARALETRKAIVRAVSTGVSTIIFPNGKTSDQIAFSTDGQVSIKLPKSLLSSESTFFAKNSSEMNFFFVIVCASLFIFCRWVERFFEPKLIDT